MASWQDPETGVVLAEFPSSLYDEALLVRNQVIRDELGAGDEIPWNPAVYDFAALSKGRVAATCRCLPLGPYFKIDRLAVDKARNCYCTLKYGCSFSKRITISLRGLGFGKRLIHGVRRFVHERYPKLLLVVHSYVPSLGFYQKSGLVPVGGEFVFNWPTGPMRLQTVVYPPTKLELGGLEIWNPVKTPEGRLSTGCFSQPVIESIRQYLRELRDSYSG